MSARLDKSKPFSQVRGDATHRYLQDGNYYDFFGKLSGTVAPEYLRGAEKKEPKKAKKGDSRESRSDALARAAEKLGTLTVVGTVNAPSLEDAARENAKALAAEENA